MAALLVASCSTTEQDSGNEGFWEAVSFRLDGTTQEVNPGTNVVHAPWVSIEGDTIRGEAGCNGLDGSFSITEQGTWLLENVIMEAAFCVPPDDSGLDEDALMQADFAFQAVIWEGEVEVSLSDDQMIWANGDDSITFKSVSTPPTTESFVPPRFTEIRRLGCAANYVVETRVPDTGQDPLEVARDADSRVVDVEPGEPLWYSGLDEDGNVIVELALGDAGPDSDYQVWTCEQ